MGARLMGARTSSPFGNIVPSNAETDLSQAAREGNLAAATRLLNANRDLVNQPDRFGHMPLREAVLARRTI